LCKTFWRWQGKLPQTWLDELPALQAS